MVIVGFGCLIFVVVFDYEFGCFEDVICCYGVFEYDVDVFVKYCWWNCVGVYCDDVVVVGDGEEKFVV